jgi:tetratricopeptide (TPR) repeat protein
MDDRMARRYGFFNWTLAIVLVAAVVVFVGAVLLLHVWRRSMRAVRAEQALPIGQQAYDQRDWDKAADQLGRYVMVHSDDTAILLKYADAQLKRRPTTPGNISLAIRACQSVWQLDRNNKEAVERLVKVYVGRGNLGDAEMVASEFLRGNDDPTLERLLAGCFVQQQKFPQAVMTLRHLIEKHPDDVLAYEVIGRLADQHPADVNKPAPEWFDQAIAANPRSATAYIIRGSFHRMHGQRDEALADFEQAEKLDLSDEDVHLRLIQELIGAQAFDKAKEHLSALQTTMSAEPILWQCKAAATLSNSPAEEQANVAETGLKELAAYPWDFMPMAVELFVAAGKQDRALDCISQMRQRGLEPAPITFLEGLVAGSRGELWKAIDSWQDAIKQGYRLHGYAGGLGPVKPVRSMIASCLVRLGDIPSAIMQLRTLVSELTNNRQLPDQLRTQLTLLARLDLARLLIQTKDWAGALEQAVEVRRIASTLVEARLIELQARVFLLGEGDSSSPNREEAWQEVEKGLTDLDEDTGGAVQVKILMAQAAVQRGQPAEAARLLDLVQSKDPSNIQVVLLRAEILNGQEKPSDAIALLRKTVEQSPRAVEPVRMLALLLNQQKDEAGCESVIKQAMTRLESPEAKRNLGLLLADLYRIWARDDDLYKWLTDLAKQSPNDIQIKQQLLTCPTVVKDPQQAQTLVDQIKSIECGTGWQGRYEQARIWINSDSFKDRYTQIVTSLQENLAANPDDQASRLLLAMAHEKAGQPQLALSLYREALSRSPNNIEVIMRTVAALYRTGSAAEYDEADHILKQVASRQLYYPDIEKLELYGRKLRWQDDVRRGALGPALDVLQEVVQRDPNDVSASLWLALISMQQGKLDEADVILKELRTRVPDSIAVIQAQVRLCLLRNNTQEALQLCNETVQKYDHAAAYILRAWTYANMRQIDKALEDFNDAAAKDPDNADIWVDRASFYQSLGRKEEANQNLHKALDLVAKSPSALDRVIPLCLTSGSPALIRDGEAVLDRARQSDPNNPGLKLLKAQFLLPKGTAPCLEQGQRLLREATAARPDLSQAWLLMGRLQLSQGQVREAVDTSLSALSHNESDKQLLLLKADVEATRSPTLAVPTLRLLAQDYPDDLDVALRLASALYRSGNKSEGQSLIQARMKADPNRPEPVVVWIGLLASDQLWADVTEQMADWTRRHPDDTAVVSTVARSLVVDGEAAALKIAESLLTTAVERHPRSAQAVGSLALLMQTLGRTAEAAMYNRKVLELDPNDVIAMNNLAWVLCEESGHCQEALDLAERGLKISPDYVDLIDTRGVAHYRLGHFEQATADFARCIELYPPNARSLASAHFHMGRACAKMGRKTLAEQHLKQAMELQDRLGSLSPEELAEARQLLAQLPKGN